MAKIDEVAKAAGVSISTVSYALSGKRPVSHDTRLRIEAAVRELGYSPNAGARMLAGSRTQIFALTEPLRRDTHAPTHMAFVLATAVAARRVDYDVLLLTDEQASAGMGRVAASGLVDIGAHLELDGIEVGGGDRLGERLRDEAVGTLDRPTTAVAEAAAGEAGLNLVDVELALLLREHLPSPSVR